MMRKSHWRFFFSSPSKSRNFFPFSGKNIASGFAIESNHSYTKPPGDVSSRDPSWLRLRGGLKTDWMLFRSRDPPVELLS